MDKTKHKYTMSYPFLYDSDKLCDYEILTDELTSLLGMSASFANNHRELKNELYKIADIAYHSNGSVRGKLAVSYEDVDWLYTRYTYYKELTEDRETLFVLPAGGNLASSLHVCRCKAKAVVRMLYKLDVEGHKVPEVLFDFANVLANYCFVVAMFANKIDKIKEIPYESKSY